MTQDQAHEMLISYGFNCLKYTFCYYYNLNSPFLEGESIRISQFQDEIIFGDLHICKNRNDSFYILSKGLFFKSGLEILNEDYFKMKIEEYLMKYKNKIVEIQKLELEEEFKE